MRQPDTEKLLRKSAEREKILEAEPSAKRLAEELGPFRTCTTPTMVEEPDGRWQLNMTSEQATREENRQRIGLVGEALARKRELETDLSMKRAAEDQTVTVTDARDGSTREIPAEREDHVARKKWARPGRRRSYFFFGSLK